MIEFPKPSVLDSHEIAECWTSIFMGLAKTHAHFAAEGLKNMGLETEFTVTTGFCDALSIMLVVENKDDDRTRREKMLEYSIKSNQQTYRWREEVSLSPRLADAFHMVGICVWLQYNGWSIVPRLDGDGDTLWHPSHGAQLFSQALMMSFMDSMKGGKK